MKNLTDSQQTIINFIKENPGCTSRQMIADLDFAERTITNNLPKLIQGNMITRQLIDNLFRYDIRISKNDKLQVGDRVTFTPYRKQKPIMEGEIIEIKPWPDNSGYCAIILSEGKKIPKSLKSLTRV